MNAQEIYSQFARKTADDERIFESEIVPSIVVMKASGFGIPRDILTNFYTVRTDVNARCKGALRVAQEQGIPVNDPSTGQETTRADAYAPRVGLSDIRIRTSSGATINGLGDPAINELPDMVPAADVDILLSPSNPLVTGQPYDPRTAGIAQDGSGLGAIGGAAIVILGVSILLAAIAVSVAWARVSEEETKREYAAVQQQTTALAGRAWKDGLAVYDRCVKAAGTSVNAGTVSTCWNRVMTQIPALTRALPQGTYPASPGLIASIFGGSVLGTLLKWGVAGAAVVGTVKVVRWYRERDDGGGGRSLTVSSGRGKTQRIIQVPV